MSVDFGLIVNLDQIEQLFDKLIATNQPFGFDIETGYSGPPHEKYSLHPETAFVVGMSVSGHPTWARYVPMRHDSGGNVADLPRFIRLLARLLATGKGVGHNLAFELRHLARLFRTSLSAEELTEYGLYPDGYFPLFSDSMVEGYNLGRFREHGLKPMTFEVFGHRMTEFSDLFPEATDKQKKAQRFNILELTPQVVSYACEDAAYSLALSQKHYPEVKDRLMYTVDMRIIPIISRMEDRGLALDWPGMARWDARAQSFAEALRAEIMVDLSAMCEEPIDINLGSSQQVGGVLYGKLGLVTTKKTDSGAMSTDAKALAGLAKKHPIVQKILDYRELKKLSGSYLTKYPRDFKYADDGRAHPSHNTCFVISGRFSVTDPAYQQLPKKYKYKLKDGTEFNLNFRDFVIAGPGHYLIGFDYCLAPETRVLTADLRWVPLRDVQVGDRLVGFDEEIVYKGGKSAIDGSSKNQCMRETVVERRVDVNLPSYRLTLEDGTIITASDDHYWVATDTKGYKGSHRSWGKSDGIKRRWLKTSELNPDCVLHRWVDPWENVEDLPVEDQLEMAYLSGFADGEGWITESNVGLGQKPGPVWDHVQQLLKNQDFETSCHSTSKAGTDRLHLQGISNSLRFLGQARPVRLMNDARTKKMWEGTTTYSRSKKFPTGMRIVKMERYEDPQDLVAIRTSTGTFVAEGLLTHNSQVELRVLAGFCKEPALVKAFAEDVDVHRATAAAMFGVPTETVTDEQRSVGKTINFATVYGQGPKGMAEKMGISIEEAKAFLEKYFATYSSLKSYLDRQTRIGVAHGKTISKFGRVHPIWALDSDKPAIRANGERLCVNAPIQGSAADIMRIAMVRCMAAINKSEYADRIHCVMNIHDALVFEVATDVHPQQVVDLVQPQVVFPIEGWPPIRADWEIGVRWGSMRKLELDANNQIILPKKELAAAG